MTADCSMRRRPGYTLPTFDFRLLLICEKVLYCNNYRFLKKDIIEVWRSLLHPCRRWLRIAFESPRRLNLRLVCTAKTRGKDRLDIWPASPLLIFITHRPPRALYSGSINIIPAFKDDGNRMCSIDIDYPPSSQLEEILVAMRKSFPVLI